MSKQFQLSHGGIGQLRIYLVPRERCKYGPLGLFSKPVYQEIVRAAKEHSLLNAVAVRTHFGYTGRGQIQADNKAVPNDSLAVCIELIAPRHELESFCEQHAKLLKGKVMVYDRLEQWKLRDDTAADREPEQFQPKAA